VGQVLHWLTGLPHRRAVPVIDGLARRCASQEGNALAVCCRLGLAADPRVQLLVQCLIEWQWPDGGWNCDRGASGRRSSFHESLTPAWGLWEYWQAQPPCKTDRSLAKLVDRSGIAFLVLGAERSGVAAGDLVTRRRQPQN
jgi:hypothetical protein